MPAYLIVDTLIENADEYEKYAIGPCLCRFGRIRTGKTNPP